MKSDPVGAVIEAMERKPTAAAMRAARRIYIDADKIRFIEDMASVIDRETGLPELIAACKEALHCMIPTGADTRTDRAMRKSLKALNKVEGT